MSKHIIDPKLFNHRHCKEYNELLTKLYPTGFNHQYSLIVKFVEKWIKSVAGEDYFKNTYIDQSISYRKMKRKSQISLLKNSNPQLAIFHRYDNSFNRENVDLYQHGNKNLLLNRIDESFFRDLDKNTFLGVRYRQIKLDFDIRIKVSTKLEQFRIYDHLRLGLKEGSTQDLYEKNVTIHIPFELVNTMYLNNTGKEIIQNDVDSISEALSYINSGTMIPIIYDLNKSTGNYDFYMLVDNYCHRINFLDQISIDDGEQIGDTYDSFMIEFSFSVYATAPLFFYHLYSDKSEISKYYLTDKTEIINDEDKIISDTVYTKLEVKNKNEQGYQLYTQSVLIDVEPGDLVINFDDLYNGLDLQDNLRRVYLYCIKRYINPELFIDIRFIYMGKELKVIPDWFNDKITVKDIPTKSSLDILLYINTEFVNKTIVELDMTEK